MRVVFTDHVADHARGFLVRLVPGVAQFVHREQHAAMHRLQAVAHIRERAADDHAHRVIEVALAHLVFDIDANDFFGEFCHRCFFP